MHRGSAEGEASGLGDSDVEGRDEKGASWKLSPTPLLVGSPEGSCCQGLYIELHGDLVDNMVSLILLPKFELPRYMPTQDHSKAQNTGCQQPCSAYFAYAAHFL